VFATYVHDLDPVALPLFGNLALRWYGMAYLLAFVCGFLLLRNLAQRGLWVLKPDKTGDFIAAAALFGVFLGGRLGYVFFYHVRDYGWGSVLNDPLLVFRVWEGGMASHGGILGLVVFTWVYARMAKVSWTGLGDGLCVVAPLGVFFGRMANFINGELYGRPAEGVAWAVKFPLSLDKESEATQSAAWQACTLLEPGLAENQSLDHLAAAVRENPKVAETLGEYLTARHPSQIYEGLLEGFLIFVILWIVRVRFPKAPDGLLTGLFFGLYAIFRIFAEQFRQPDAAWVIEDMVTMGQFLSFFMFAFSAGFLFFAWRKHKAAKVARA